MLSAYNLFVIAAAGYLAYQVLAFVLDRFLLASMTCTNDLESLGLPRGKDKLKGTALVVGGSMAGLLTARVLSTHFDKVVVVESEDLVNESTERKHILQFWHIHAYLPVAYSVMKSLFNSFDEAASEAGGIVQKISYTVEMKSTLVPAKIDNQTVTLPRNKLEPLVRKLVRNTCTNVTFITGTVTSLEISADRTRVSAVHIRPKEGSQTQDRIDVALLADCSGPATAGIKWLREMGFETPKKVSYQPYIYYNTLYLPTTKEIRENLEWPNNQKWTEEGKGGTPFYGVLADGERGQNRTLLMLALDKTQFAFSVCYYGKKNEQTIENVEQLVEAVAKDNSMGDTLRKQVPLMVEEAQRLGLDTTPQKTTIVTCYKYDMTTIKNIPANFIMIGDSRVRLNPIFGQGCGKVSIEVATLDACLRKTSGIQVPASFATQFFQIIANRSDGMFDATKVQDYAFESTKADENETRETGAFIRALNGRIIQIAEKEPWLAKRFWRVTFALRPPTDLLAPPVLFSLAKHALLA